MGKSIAVIAASVSLAAVVAGCGSGGSSNSSSAAVSSGADPAHAASKRLAVYYRGTDRALPSAAPKRQANKNVWVIACARAAEGCAIPANAIKEAGSKLGWKVTIFDGGFDPTTQSNGIRSAVADHADAIVLIAVDCPTVATALKQAKAGKIKIYGDFSLDCNEGAGGQPLFDASAVFGKRRTQYSAYLRDVHARVGSDWAIAKAGSKANVVLVEQTDLINSQIESKAYKSLFSENCPSCTVTTVPFTGQDLLGGNLKGIVAAGLTKDPGAQVVIAPYDAAITLGVGAGVQQAERTSGKKLLLIGYEGLTANMDQIKKGGPTDLSTGFPSQWVGWQTVDELNRLFAGQPLVDEGMGFQAVDKDHNVPTATTFYDGNVGAGGKPRQDYKANFLKIWGVS